MDKLVIGEVVRVVAGAGKGEIGVVESAVAVRAFLRRPNDETIAVTADQVEPLFAGFQTVRP